MLLCLLFPDKRENLFMPDGHAPDIIKETLPDSDNVIAFFQPSSKFADLLFLCRVFQRFGLRVQKNNQ